MKIFISWSGKLSQKVAIVLKEYLSIIIHDCDYYVSSEDIDKGARWSTDISSALENSDFGILCISKENLNMPWLNFEAGAISKSIKKARVVPFLFGISNKEFSGPIAQFQSICYNEKDIKNLLKNINSAKNNNLTDLQLETLFDRFWPDIKHELDNILDTTNSDKKTEINYEKDNEDLKQKIDVLQSDRKYLKERKFSNHHAVQPKLEECIKDVIEKDNKITLKVIGAALFYSWPFLENFITQYFHKNTNNKQIELKLALLDEAWIQLWKLELWHKRHKKTDREMNRFKEDHKKYIDDGSLIFDIYYYSHLPNMHGICVNNKVLFLSDSYWNKDKSNDNSVPSLVLGESEYTFYEESDKLDGDKKINQFNHFFDFLKINSRPTVF